MYKKILSLVLAMVMIMGSVSAYADSMEEYKDYINVKIEDENQITTYAVHKEKEYKDHWYGGAPYGSASFEFSIDSNDNKLNVYFDNESSTEVTLSLFKKSGWFGNWEKVDSIKISGKDEDYFTVNNPNDDYTYKVEVSNNTGDKIYGELRVRSFYE